MRQVTAYLILLINSLICFRLKEKNILEMALKREKNSSRRKPFGLTVVFFQLGRMTLPKDFQNRKTKQ